MEYGTTGTLEWLADIIWKEGSCRTTYEEGSRRNLENVEKCKELASIIREEIEKRLDSCADNISEVYKALGLE